MEKINQPLRYMLTTPGEPPRFLTAEDNKSILHSNRLYSSTVSTPNLTGRLNAIVAYADAQLANMVDVDVVYSLANKIRAWEAVGLNKIKRMREDAEEELHFQEMAGVWRGWFQQRRLEALLQRGINFREMMRLDELQFNGRAPF
jgi:hypothetical protein